MSQYTQLEFSTNAQQAETIAELSFTHEALAVDYTDPLADSQAEQALFDEPHLQAIATATPTTWQRVNLRVLFAQEQQADALLLTLLAAQVLDDLSAIRRSTIDELDWVRLTQSQFAPIVIDDLLCITPSWGEAPAHIKHIIEMDPGLAFGTGTHATTGLCLRWLTQHATALIGKTVLDYGCGSGILAIAAAKLGADTVLATDIDNNALEVTRQNAQKNHAALTCLRPTELPPACCDLLIANILSQPLITLAPTLVQHLRHSGTLVLSGILSRQTQQLIEAYAALIALKVFAHSDDAWVCLYGNKP